MPIGYSDGMLYESHVHDALDIPWDTGQNEQPQKVGMLDSPYEQAQGAMDLNPQERSLYERHLKNLYSSGGVDNADGSRSTLFSTTVGVEDKTYMIPTVRDGKILPADQALEAAKKEGLDFFPSYASPGEAKTRYDQMHEYMEQDTKKFLDQRNKVYDPFNTKTQSKFQDRVPPNAPFPSAPTETVTKNPDTRADASDGSFSLATASIATLGLESFRRLMSGFDANAATARGERTIGHVDRGTLEREGINTYQREVRRSPADGTFRTSSEMRSDWNTFTTPRDQTSGMRPMTSAEFEMERDRIYRESPGPREYVYEGSQRAPQGWDYANSGTRGGRNRELMFEAKGKQGVIEYSYNPSSKNIHIHWMGAYSPIGNENIKPHELGVDKVKELFTQLAKDHPEAETISADRVSGARAKAGTRGRVVRQIPREQTSSQPSAGTPSSIAQPPGLPTSWGAPGTRVTDLY